jgi:methionyl aminopeptidase
MFGRRERIQVKTPAQLLLMRAAGLVVGRTLAVLAEAVRPGVTTAELDRIAEDAIRSAGAVPSFLGYGEPPFPASICASVNDEVVHGIPGSRELAEGDLISIDCGAILQGWHGDAAITVPVGSVPAADRELSRVTQEGMWRGLAAAQVGGRLTDIGHAVESYVRSQPSGAAYGIVEEYVGHGIGTAMHMEPNVPNFGAPGRGPELLAGMALAVEPMLCAGSRQLAVREDEWTVATVDGRRAAHWEHTVALTDQGPWVLTALDGGAAKFAELGIGSPAASRD